MGLDVYLYKCADRNAADRSEAEYEQGGDRIWGDAGDYDSLTDAQKDEARAKIAALEERLDIVDYRHESRQRIEIDSAKYPEHMFKVGYFRSSYNDGGINNHLRRRGLPTLYQMFSADGEYHQAPDWGAALGETRKVLENYRKVEGGEMGGLDVIEVSPNMFTAAHDLPHSAEDARAIFEGQSGSERAWRAWSCKEGEFYLDGIEVFAIIPGIANTFKRPCTYVVYKSKKEDGGDWYEQALEIVIETIEYVMAQDDKEDYYLAWSS